MDNKKKIIIAIVIFIFLGLTVFTFANPNESENKAQGEGNGTTETGTKTDKEDDSKEKVNNETNTNENDNTNVNNHGVTVNRLLTTDLDDDESEDSNLDTSYNDALVAVINAEEKIDEESYNIAKDLVNNVTDETSKEELSDRLEEVKNGIDAKALVATLESKTNSAANKTDMTDARDYRTEEDIVNLVAGLSNEDLKNELQSTLATLALLLDDTTNPKVNIEDGAILSETTKIEIEDDNEFTITLTKDEDSKEITNGTEVSDGDGVYTLMVVDEAFNEETITFTIDTTDPSFNVKSGSHSTEDIKIVVDDLTLDYIEIYNQDEVTKQIVTDSEFTLTDEATYRVTAYDKAGHSKDLWVAIDKTNPEIDGVVNEGTYKTATVTISDKFLTEVLVNGETQEGIVTTGTKNEGKELVLEFTEEGTYTVVAKDKVGNETPVTFTIDTTKPVITGVEDGAYYNTEVTPIVIDKNFKNATLKYNGVHIKAYKVGDTLVNEGTYTLVATDFAMNETKLITFTIDRTEPIFVGYPESGFTEEDFVINVDDLTDVVITLSKRNASAEEGYPKNVEDGYEITEEGSYILEAKDKAGNTTRVNLGLDKNAPKVTGVEDGEHYSTSVTPVVTDLQLAGAIRLNGEKYTSGTEITEEGDYTLVATDRVGHTTTVTFTIDKTAPTITKVPDGKIVNHSVSPKIEDANLDTVTLIKNGEEVKNYQDNMYELSHEGTYEITACDKAKNCTTVSFEIDKTAPVMTKLQVYNKNNTSSKYVKNGDTVRVLVTFDEKLGTLPTLAIGNTTATLNEISDGKGGIIYSADLTIPEDESELAEGTLTYTISGYKDVAGNEGNVLNETLAQMTLTYDRTKPGYNYIGIMNIDQVTEGYAKVGDRVWVYVVVDEYVSEEPTITINGEKAKIVQTEDGAKFNDTWYKYVGEVVMTEEMEEGEITFTIDGYKDLAGNPGETLTNTNINKGLEKIELDKTAPSIVWNGTVYGPDYTDTIYYNDRFDAIALDEISGIAKIYTNDADRTNTGLHVSALGYNYKFRLIDNSGNESTFNLVLENSTKATNLEELKIALEKGGIIYLDEDVVLGEKLTISSDTTIRGGTITRDASYTGNLFTVEEGVTLTLNDTVIDGNNNWTFDYDSYNSYLNSATNVTSAETAHKFTTLEANKPVATTDMFIVKGNLKLSGVTIKNHAGNGGASVIDDGNSSAKITMTNTTIEHCTTPNSSTVVSLEDGGQWIINDGTVITGNHGGSNGGIVRVNYATGKVTMNGGKITNNTAVNSNGTFIMMWNQSTFEMNGGEISNNSGANGWNNGRAGVIYGHSKSHTIINGGTISNNKGIGYGGIDAPYTLYENNATVVINGGQIINNTSIVGYANKDLNDFAYSNPQSEHYDPEAKGAITVNGGTFTQDVSKWIAEGKTLTDNGNGTWTVK